MSALNEAKQRAEQVGQQNQQMTEIAQHARLLADAYVQLYSAIENHHFLYYT